MHAPPLGACESLVCALKLVANQQTGGDRPVDTICDGLQEQDRMNISSEWRRFIEVDQGGQARVFFPNVVIRKKEVDDLALPEGKAGILRTIIDTSIVEVSRWRLPPVDEEWHAIFSSHLLRRRGSGMEEQEVKVRHPSESSRARNVV